MYLFKNKKRTFSKTVASMLIIAWVFSGWPQFIFRIQEREIVFPPTPEYAFAAASTTVLTSINRTSWTVPDDWNDNDNYILVIGGGGGGAGPAGNGSGGGGGAAAAYSNNLSISSLAGTSVTIQIGEGGAGGTASGSATGGEDSWFNAASLAACSDLTACIGADGGDAASGATAGPGGDTTETKGENEFAGGTGGAGAKTQGTDVAGGGGGAGSAGTDGAGTNGGSGGTGGAGDTNNTGEEAHGGGGSAGCDIQTPESENGTAGGVDGGVGGYNSDCGGAAGGTGGSGGGNGGPGSSGSGGGGGDQVGNGGNGGANAPTLSGLSVGSGGGGGGGAGTGGNGGLYGGGGGGADGTSGGAGGQGFIVIYYNPDTIVVPTIDTNAASGVTESTATLNGDVDATGGNVPNVCGFAYGTDSTLATVIATTTGATCPSGVGPFSEAVGSLDEETTYYFRAYATNFVGDGLGDIVEFTTTAASLPAVDFATSTPGRIGSALEFDAIDDSVNGGDIDGGGANVRTIAFWMKAATTTASQPLINIDDTDPDYIDTDSSSNITANSFTATSIYVDGSTASVNIPDTEWHHVVVTVSGGLTADNFQVGSTTEGRFGGDMDDVRVYNKVLSFDEVQRLYKLGATTKISTTVNTQPTLEDGLVGHWTFDGPDVDLGQDTAEIIDRSGQGNTGDWLSHASTTVPGRIGQAIEFDGADDFVDIVDSATLRIAGTSDSFTVSAWVYRDVSSTIDHIVGTENDVNTSSQGWVLQRESSNNRYRFRTSDGTTNTQSSTPIDSGAFQKWQNVVGVVDRTSNKQSIYMDGVLYSSDDITGDGSFEKNFGVEIGMVEGNTTRAWPGNIDDVRIYNRALTADEITRLYKLGATTKIATTLKTQPDLERGLVGHWTFDGKDIGPNILDRSGSGNAGNLDFGSSGNTATTTAPGRIGQAMEFDGTDDKIGIADNATLDFGTGSFTVVAWVKAEGGDGRIVYKYDNVSTTRGFMLLVNASIQADFKLFDTGGSSQANVGGGPLTDVSDGWHHVVGVRDGTATRIYIDGIEKDNNTGATADVSGTTEMRIGADIFNDKWFDGILDDVRIYDRALSDDEITRLYLLGR
jgi:hypothetical protein